MKVSYGNLKRGQFDNPFRKSVCGVGCLGNTKTRINGRTKKSYSVWSAMIERCYGTRSKTVRPTYQYNNCKVCDEWLCYENFEKWFNENYYEIPSGEEVCLDKDILFKHNYLYSPSTCIFAPKRINGLFTNRQLHRGKYPVGVVGHGNKFIARCNSYKTQSMQHIGTFDNINDAFNAYKEYKEKYIKEVADLYKDEIPKKLYDALCSYEVEITD